MRKRILNAMALSFLSGIVLLGCGSKNVVVDGVVDTESMLAVQEASIEETVTDTQNMSQTQEQVRTEEVRYITREYLLDNSILTEEELEGVDIDTMSRDNGWVEGVEKQAKWKTMFEAWKTMYMTEEYYVDYSYLSTSIEERKMSDVLSDQLKTIGFSYNEGTYNLIFVADLEEHMIYAGETKILEEKVVPRVQMQMTKEQEQEIRELFDSAGVFSWETYYQGYHDEDSTGWFRWDLYYEVEDGTVYATGGFGDSGKSAPENFYEFYCNLKNAVGIE